jgi:hypothetical protein
MFFILGITLSITKGILKVMCAKRIVVNPELKCKNLNKSIRDIPVTISALIIGILVIPIIKERSLVFNPIIAIHAMVPIIVDIIVERIAIESVLIRALATASSESRLAYHFKVNPPQRALDLLELKESTISVIIGAYINKSKTPR